MKAKQKGERKVYRNSQAHVTLLEVLIETRKRTGMSQLAVSSAIDRPPEFCNKVEHGVRMLSSVELFEYCRAIKTTAEFVTAEVERRVVMKRKLLGSHPR